MDDVSVLLTDEFIEFSKKIAEIHELKKQKQEELKKVYESFKSELHSLDEKAKMLTTDWEDWKTQQKANKK